MPMRTYKLEVIFDENGVGVHEKTNEGLNIVEARIIVAVLEEYKQRMLAYVITSQQETDLKGQSKN